jgi:hypothetical protein
VELTVICHSYKKGGGSGLLLEIASKTILSAAAPRDEVLINLFSRLTPKVTSIGENFKNPYDTDFRNIRYPSAMAPVVIKTYLL